MKVEIWSDVVCPWCYIGKRRFETALTRFEHRDQIEVIWRSFELDPNAPPHYEGTLDERLAKKYSMSLQQAVGLHERVAGIAAAEGLQYDFANARYGNTFNAHRLIHLAAKHNLQDSMKERLMKAYFSEGEPIGDQETLVKLAGEIGLDEGEARSALETSLFSTEVRADEERAVRIGITGVPFFLLAEKHGISGAQPAEALLNALEKVWAEFSPDRAG